MDNQVAYLLDEFKIPYTNPYCPEDWKDWYHYVLYNPVSQIRFLYNLSFTGRPVAGYVTDTCFLTLPGNYFSGDELRGNTAMKTYGFARNFYWHPQDLQMNPMRYQTKDVDFNIKGLNTSIVVESRQTGCSFNLAGNPAATPIYIPEMAPYGNGFIGWGVIPGFNMKGTIKIGDRSIEVDDTWYCYHDRNFGRFNWGNIGWVWFVVNVIDQQQAKWTYVLHRSNDNQYRNFGSSVLFVYQGNNLVKVFINNTIDIELQWEKNDHIPPILPGAMASVFGNRSIVMPRQLIISAKDETDFVHLTLDVETQSELIVPDNLNKEYTFIKELSGTVNTRHSITNQESQGNHGFFYAEHVH